MQRPTDPVRTNVILTGYKSSQTMYSVYKTPSDVRKAITGERYYTYFSEHLLRTPAGVKAYKTDKGGHSHTFPSVCIEAEKGH